MRIARILAVFGLVMLTCLAEARVKSKDVPSPPTSDYEIRKIRGWKVYLQKPLLNENKETGDEAVEILNNHLYRITRVVPAPALAELRKIPLWLHHTGKGNSAQYHPSREWLKDNDFNLDLAQCVDLGDAKRFIHSTRRQACVVLHELAHGYHHQVWDWGDGELTAAYKKAESSGKYDNVLRSDGRKVRAYAMTDHKEYFAETSEAFFGTNDFYPFVNAELRIHDPDMYKVLKRFWAGPPDQD